MAKEIKQIELKTLGIMILYGLGFYWIATTAREWVIQQYGIGTAMVLGILILLFIAYQFNVRKPYWINGR